MTKRLSSKKQRKKKLRNKNYEKMDKVKKKCLLVPQIYIPNWISRKNCDADFLNEISEQFLQRLLPQQFTLKDSVYV